MLSNENITLECTYLAFQYPQVPLNFQFNSLLNNESSTFSSPHNYPAS